MDLGIEWQPPVDLKDEKQEALIYNLDHGRLPNKPGVYVFGRKWGNNFEALYVGKANSIQSRVRGQLKNLPLMLHIQRASDGKRVLLSARFVSKPGQQLTKCLTLIERSLIRYFLSEGHDLVNKQGTKLRVHKISTVGRHPRKLVPRTMYLDR